MSRGFAIALDVLARLADTNRVPHPGSREDLADDVTQIAEEGLRRVEEAERRASLSLPLPVPEWRIAYTHNADWTMIRQREEEGWEPFAHNGYGLLLWRRRVTDPTARNLTVEGEER